MPPVAPSKGSQQNVVIKTYKGNQQQATEAFQFDAAHMAAQGYRPTAQTWAPGSYGCGSFVVAALLCLVLIGFIVFIYMLIVKPAGTLTVTYALQESSPAPVPHLPADEKTCPKCAEQVKAAAKVCRFCGNNFGGSQV